MATTALELWRAQDARLLRCGCDAIDDLLRGGFRSGMLTEVCGEASAGKTQLCLQLLLQSTLPPPLGGLGSTACYICTEGIGSIKRLHELAGVYAARYGARMATQRKRKRKCEADAAPASNAFLDGVFIEQVYEADGLLELLQSRLPTLLEEQNTKLVVIDSIAAVFRLEATTSIKVEPHASYPIRSRADCVLYMCGPQEASRRSRLMFHMANCMRILSAQYQVVFVVSNQVTGNFSDDVHSAHKPALGLSWSNCINQRLMITRTPHSVRRRIHVAMSPYLPNASARFEITSEGVADVDD